MMFFLFLLGLALCAATPSEKQNMKLQRGGCPMFWFTFNGRCYRYYTADKTWADAEFHCVSEGGNLVSIHNLREHNFVKNFIGSFDPAQGRTWIGLTDLHKNSGWMWSDGSRANFLFWNAGQPNNAGGAEACVETNHGFEKKWNDAPCSDRLRFVCALRTVCP